MKERNRADKPAEKKLKFKGENLCLLTLEVFKAKQLVIHTWIHEGLTVSK